MNSLPRSMLGDPIKLVVVGDGATGKSSLLITYTTNTFPDAYVPTVFDNFEHTVMVDGRLRSCRFFDTAGQEDYDRLRPLAYPETDTFIVTFAVDDRSSFDNVSSKWLLELRQFAPNIPVILVGTKSDLRSSAGSDELVDISEAITLVESQGLAGFVEVSSKLQSGISDCFHRAISSAIRRQQQEKLASGRSGSASTRRGKSIRSGRRGRTSSNSTPRRPTAPRMPPAGKAPWIHPVNATFSSDFEKLLGLQVKSETEGASSATGSNSIYTDIRIALETEKDGSTSTYCVEAHRIILFSSCPNFEERLKIGGMQHVGRKRMESVGVSEECCTICLDEEANFLVVPCGHQCGCEGCLLDVQQADGLCPICREPMLGIQKAISETPKDFTISETPLLDDSNDSSMQTLKLSGTTPRALNVLLNWLYTGRADALPNANDQQPPTNTSASASASRPFQRDDLAFLNEVHELAGAFDVEELQTFVENIKAGEGWLNPSFETFLSEKTGAKAMSRFFKDGELSDVIIKLDDGTEIFAHRAVLAGRCEFFRSLLAKCDMKDDANHIVIELHQTSKKLANAVIEFLYRDHVSFISSTPEDSSSKDSSISTRLNPLEILPHAHELRLIRLISLCELEMTKLIHAAIATFIEKSEVDIVGVLNMAKHFGAAQLEKWCLHFMSSNFGPMSKRPEWKQISAQHLEFVTAHQWPPIRYLEQVKHYKDEMTKWEAEVSRVELNIKSGSVGVRSGDDKEKCCIM